MAAERFDKTVLCNPWLPQRPTHKQALFLLHCDTREILYGGAAGGGKTSAILMGAAQFVDVPGYSALILRTSFPELMQADGLIPRSKEWWMQTKAHWSGQEKRWTFPSGATITFGYLESDDDVYQYQGAALQNISIDELTAHTEFRYRYLFSRLRKPAEGPLAEVPLRMRAGSNPGGKGHDFVKGRFVPDEYGRADPDERNKRHWWKDGRLFIPARREDNAHLDQVAYAASLAILDPITRAQLDRGDWTAYKGGRFKREWFRRYSVEALGFGQGGEYVLQNGKRWRRDQCWRFLTCDPAATAEETARKGSDPDYTVVCAWAVTPDFEVVWLDCVRVRKEIPDIVPVIESVYSEHQPEYVAIEAVASNRGVLQLAMRTSMIIREVGPRGLDKLVRATPAMVLAESGRLYLPRSAHWLEEAESELLRFTGDPKQDAHDDVCLVAGTLVETAEGPVAIEDVQAGQRVLTRGGWCSVSWAGMTSPVAPCLTVCLSDGSILAGTASHPVWVEGKGFVRLDCLSYADRMLTCNQHLLRVSKRSNSTASSSGGILTRNGATIGCISPLTTPGKRHPFSFTGRSGRRLTALFQRATMSITTTEIPSTTTLAISFVLPGQSIAGLMPREERIALRSSRRILSEFVRWPLPGIPPKKGEPGTRSTQRLSSRTANRSSAYALSVASPGSHSLGQRGTSFALALASLHIGEQAALTTRCAYAPAAARNFAPTATPRREPVPVHVLKVCAAKRGPVFNLKVDGAHEFFANGVLVHNCDALSYMASALNEIGQGGAGGMPMILGSRAY